VMREAVDDALRSRITQMSNAEAWAVSREFTTLGRDLQACAGQITISRDLPLLGIAAGSYPVQAFLYDHFIKCWFNAEFGDEYSDLVNFDWYHPEFAFRFDGEELRRWFEEEGLSVVDSRALKAQHYVAGRRG
jgi:hypothetical protein